MEVEVALYTWQEGYTCAQERKTNKYLDDMNLEYRYKRYLSLRSDIGGKVLNGPGWVAANDVSRSLVLA